MVVVAVVVVVVEVVVDVLVVVICDVVNNGGGGVGGLTGATTSVFVQSKQFAHAGQLHLMNHGWPFARQTSNLHKRFKAVVVDVVVILPVVVVGPVVVVVVVVHISIESAKAALGEIRFLLVGQKSSDRGMCSQIYGPSSSADALSVAFSSRSHTDCAATILKSSKPGRPTQLLLCKLFKGGRLHEHMRQETETRAA